MVDLVMNMSKRWQSGMRPATRRWVLRTPYVWDAMATLRRSHATRLARTHTSLVIEGFPRSGNSYSRAAFEIANGETAHLGHHLHAAAHVLRATRMGLPTVVLIREPREAILSYLAYSETFAAEQVLRDYISFYETVRQVADRVVVARFERVVSDFGGVLREVNEKFATTLSIYEKSPANEDAARERVEAFSRVLTEGILCEDKVARPSAARTRAKATLQRTLEAPASAKLLREAQELYAGFVIPRQGTAQQNAEDHPAGTSP